MIPKAAASERRFRTIALSASTVERNARVSRISVRSRTSPSTYGKLPNRACRKSRSTAARPVSVPFVPFEARVGAVDGRLDAGRGAVDRGEPLDERVRPLPPLRRRGRSDDARHRASFAATCLGVAAVLDEDVERLHHAGADPGRGELVAGGDRRAGAGEVLQLRLGRVQLRAEAGESGDDRPGRPPRPRPGAGSRSAPSGPRRRPRDGPGR